VASPAGEVERLCRYASSSQARVALVQQVAGASTRVFLLWEA
jgi:hypothetical protein